MTQWPQVAWVKWWTLTVPRPPLTGVGVSEALCPDASRGDEAWQWDMLERAP